MAGKGAAKLAAGRLPRMLCTLALGDVGHTRAGALRRGHELVRARAVPGARAGIALRPRPGVGVGAADLALAQGNTVGSIPSPESARQAFPSDLGMRRYLRRAGETAPRGAASYTAH